MNYTCLLTIPNCYLINTKIPKCFGIGTNEDAHKERVNAA